MDLLRQNIESAIAQDGISGIHFRDSYNAIRKIYYKEKLSVILLSQDTDLIINKIGVLKEILELCEMCLEVMNERDTEHPIEDGGKVNEILFKRILKLLVDLSYHIKQDLFHATNHLAMIKQNKEIQEKLDEQSNKFTDYLRNQVKLVGTKFYSLLILALLSPLVASIMLLMNK